MTLSCPQLSQTDHKTARFVRDLIHDKTHDKTHDEIHHLIQVLIATHTIIPPNAKTVHLS